MAGAPHPIPYQGSKRRQAAAILEFVPPETTRLIEPFAGSGAVTLAAAARDRDLRFVLGDSLPALAGIWSAILENPERLAADYAAVWHAQAADPRAHFLEVRAAFNRDRDPVKLLYLVARCVGNAVRFSSVGGFNQSADHRRRGRSPERMTAEIASASLLLRSRTEVYAADFRQLLAGARPGDVVYLDPPYQGVRSGDRRYHSQLAPEDLYVALGELERRGVPYLLSYDGQLGEVCYGTPPPAELGLHRIAVATGRSAQATLAGRTDCTVESLYVSATLQRSLGPLPARLDVTRPEGGNSPPRWRTTRAHTLLP